MKKLITYTFLFMLIIQKSICQVSLGSNSWAGVPSNYLGWDATVGSPPLLIKTTNPDAINFQTGLVSRMTILGNTGFVGIGNTSVGVFTPVRRLHLREGSGNTTYFLMTGNNTGDAITDGFQISLNNNAAASLQNVDLNQQESAPLNFLTSGLPRLQIAANGNVGVGDYTTFTPQSQLHQHSIGNTTYHQFSTLQTTTGVNRGMTFGFNWMTNPYTTVASNYSPVELTQYEFAPILIRSTNSTVTLNPISERLRIVERPGFFWGGAAGNITKITINRGTIRHPTTFLMNNSTFVNPIAMLNIGTEVPASVTPTNWAGNRLWMDVGIYNSHQTDNMYIGLKQEGEFDNLDAVVNWGDNLPGSSNNDGIQNLRFIFTATGTPSNTYSNAPAATANGLEVARMTSNGNVGIGDFYNNGTIVWAPQARLEILDAKDLTSNYPANSRGEPQLKLTYTHATSAMFGIATDFQTTVLGDLYINPYTGASSTKVNRNVGINTNLPGNTLEINSNDANATTTVGGGSGLRFTDLTTASTPLTANPFGPNNPCMLTVNATGDVVLVKDAGLTKADNGLIVNPSQNVQLGQIVATSGNPAKFIRNSEIPLNGFSLIFTDNIAVKNNTSSIGIGTFTPNAKLHIYRPANDITDRVSNPVALRVESVDISTSSSYTGSGYGVYSLTSGANRFNIGGGFEANSGSSNIGVLATCTATYVSSSINSSNIGGDFTGSNAQSNFGIRASANFGQTSTGGYFESSLGSANNTGVIAFGGSTPPSISSGYNIGGRFHANAATNNYAVYASTSTTCTATSSTNCANVAGYFDGCVVTTTGSYTSSDAHLKNNIEPLLDALQIINQLDPKKYFYDSLLTDQINLPEGQHYGLIANDLVGLLPNTVKEFRHPALIDTLGNMIKPEIIYLGINYVELVPILIAGMKEQQQQIDSLIAAGNQPKMANPNTIEVTLSNQSKIILNQNDPNPFKESTTINYFIPDNVNAAQLLFYDNSGTILKTVDFKEKGQGSILIYGSNLSSGVYTYTLLADGKPIETKRMVKIK